MKLHYWKTVFIIEGIIPLGFIISLLTFYVHATVVLGYFPSYNKPDPKNLNFYHIYSDLINIFFGIWFFSFPILIILIFFYLILQRKKKWKLVVFSLTTHLIAIALLSSDIMKWFAD